MVWRDYWLFPTVSSPDSPVPFEYVKSLGTRLDDQDNMADGGEAEATPQQSQQSSEEPLGMRAVLIGATGAIGECLLGELLCSKVCLMGSTSPPVFVCIYRGLYRGSLAPFTNEKNRGSRITDVKFRFPNHENKRVRE